MYKEKFMQRFKELRKEKGLSKAQLGESAGMNPSQLSKYELGRNEPTMSVIIKLCKYFGVSSDYLIGLKDE